MARSQHSQLPVSAKESPHRPHKCFRPGCTSQFARSSDLSRHDRTHTQLRPHKCEWPGCGKGFNQRGQLRTHYNSHTGERPHQCEFCSRRFGDPASRTRHKNEAHGDPQTNQCPLCPSSIKRKSTFKEHLRSKHGVEWEAESLGGVLIKTEDVEPHSVNRVGKGQAGPATSYRPSAIPNSSFDDGQHEAAYLRRLYHDTNLPSQNSTGLMNLTSHSEPRVALATGTSVSLWPPWQQNLQTFSPHLGLGSLPSSRSQSTVPSCVDSPSSSFSQDSHSPLYSYRSSPSSSTGSSPQAFHSMPSFEYAAAEVSLRRQFHSRSAPRRTDQQLGGYDALIDPALMRHA